MTSVLTAPVPTAAAAPERPLLSVLGDALWLCAERGDDDLRGGWRAGEAVLSLSALARRASAALGVDPGVPLTGGPGVVVRDLSSATGLLIRAVGPSAGPPADVGEHLLERLRGGLTPAA